MRTVSGLVLAAAILLSCPWSNARAGWAVGVRVVGGPGCYRPCYGYRPYFGGVAIGVGVYAPYYPVYPVYPAPVVVTPAPVVVQSAPAVQPGYSSQSPPPAPEPLPQPRPMTAPAEPPATINPTGAATPVSRTWEAEINACLQQLQSSQDQARAEALVQLGRLKAERATGPMVKALNEDPTPAVRDAAARGLGLIGARSALPALQRAALQDSDREVRHSASLAADVIRGNLPR